METRCYYGSNSARPPIGPDGTFSARLFLSICFFPAAVAGVITGDIFPLRLVFRRQPLLYLKPAVRHVPKAHIEQ